jgi:D-tyrosyl-tRNA(Tyr) deacylase
LLVFVGIGKGDTKGDIEWMVDKIVSLRIFENDAGRFDRSIIDIDGELLIVSQFTLYGDCSRGRRPSFSEAMAPQEARPIFDLFVNRARQRLKRVEIGVFQALMEVELINDGPVTLMLNSRSRNGR